jgi:hypothetical protein
VQKALRAAGETLIAYNFNFWTSNEFTTTVAYIFNFGFGYVDTRVKTVTAHPVRAIRSF